ncbi:hypothetical protein SASPL_111650 [Salvia splendens]|uniref:Uncharacterized protein n=1 Tax=Salvia splendens TaxID=180675 RepID=A0A8X9A4I9_SALSN|nr:uncharacterized protein LOC121800774 [Salvia splendens]KAG6427406.1 hypothetical protein SASPL_111650 [Salvia splendens]
MKGSISKPLSSPRRAEKFPPPLMRFLRSNVGSRSRSRSRSRSSPIFNLRGRRSAPAAIEEPSSPKVTCIGQVRIRRSKATRAVKKRRRWKSLCFGNNPLGGLLCKCSSIFGWGYSKKVDSKIENLSNGHYESPAENKRGFMETYSPPKNALMLTRCRSAPYRSSSLGGRFWGFDNEDKSDELAISSNSEKEEEELEEMENSAENVEEMKKIGGDAQRLRRCKSEPASTGERLAVSQPSLIVRG